MRSAAFSSLIEPKRFAHASRAPAAKPGRKAICFHGGRRLDTDSLEALMNMYGMGKGSSRSGCGGGVETIDDTST